MKTTKKIVIDPARGGEDYGNIANNITEKDFNLEISQYIQKRLNDLGIETSITRDSDITLDNDTRIKKIQDFYGSGSDVIVISNALTSNDSGSEIIYALRNSSGLPEIIANELKKVGIPFNKYYQRRLPADTSKDYNQIIRDTANNQTIIIYYGNILDQEDANYLKNNKEELAEAVVIALTNYLNVPYTPQAGGNYYKVQKGDTLYSIAKKYNTTTSELINLNNLSSTNLSINQVLKIPTKEEDNSQTFNTYTVKRGDTLYSIAKTYNTTIDTLKQLNNLSNNTLSINQVLKIPNNESNYLTYTVKRGDTLYSIAKTYNTTIDTLKQLNNLPNNTLSINQILKIPNNESNYLTYTVKKGDTLYSIAKNYNITPNEIKQINNLTTNLLSINQILKIPIINN